MSIQHGTQVESLPTWANPVTAPTVEYSMASRTGAELIDLIAKETANQGMNADLSLIDISAITDIDELFSHSRDWFAFNIVGDMNYMFSGATQLSSILESGAVHIVSRNVSNNRMFDNSGDTP